MGLDLTLLVVESWDTSGKVLWGFAHTILRLGSGKAMADPIDELKPENIPQDANFSSYVAVGSDGDPCYGVLKSTPYGRPYTWVTAAKLLPIMRELKPTHPATAYIAALEPDNKIVLHWH